MEARSRANRSVRLEARFEGPAPEGMSVKMAGDQELLPVSTGVPVLTIGLPARPGPIRGTIVIESPDLPGWSRTYVFDGVVEDRPREGKIVEWQAEDLGDLRPGEKKAFAAPVRSRGTEDVTIHEVKLVNGDRVRLDRRYGPELILAGGELQITGVVVAPKVAGNFRARIRVRSDADNVRVWFDTFVVAKVVPDYAPRPDRIGPRNDAPVQETEYAIEIHGRQGTEPFVIDQVMGHEAVFTLVSRGGTEPAVEQTVVFKLKRDAPTDPMLLREFNVRLRLSPVGYEVVVPVHLRLHPPIYADPPRPHLGRVPRGHPGKTEIRLVAIANRRFKVKSAETQKGLFEIEVRHAPGLAWRILVGIPNRSKTGLLQDRIVIETDDPDVPKIVVPVKAVVR
jgi:hypothetical protein